MEYYKNNKAHDTKDLNQFNGNGETILFIDDEVAFVEVSKILLEIHGYTILTAYDGIEGLSAFLSNKEQIDIIVCDLNMPKLAGRKFLEKLIEFGPEMKILIISGSIEEYYLDQYLVPEKIEFLRKPFMNDTMLKILSSMLGQLSMNTNRNIKEVA